MASLRAVPAASLLLCGGPVFSQQVISSNTPSGFTAADGDVTVNSGITVGSTGLAGTAMTVNNVNVGTITVNGSLQASTSNGTALYLLSTAPRVTLTNTGTIRSKGGVQLYSVTDVINTGTMFGSDKGIIVTSGASGSTITNNGSLNASGQSFAAVDILSGATVTSITNGTGRTMSGFVPINNNGTITLLTNNGTLRSGHFVASSAIGGGGTITTLINRGTITPASNAAGIGNRVVHLANAQGGNSPLTISTAPTNYSIIINSPTSFGRLRPQGFSGTMGFDVYAGSSIVTGYYYSSVLQGVTAADLANTTGTFEGVNWSLSLLSGSTTTWDLCFGSGACSYSLSSNILSGQTYSSANVGTSVNRAFDGGTLQMASPSTVSGNFTLTGNGGTIDQRGHTSVFSGSFSNANAGTAGKLTIRNSGTAEQGSVTLAAANTHTGGIDVLSGAKLVINSPQALGSGTLNLIGSATVPAALGTTQTMTISNPITVAGDPVFDVAAGTTLTIATPITDGGSPGDVVVRGTGVLSLTAVNTYTGLTTVDPGANLALNAAGSIATTSSVTNRGRIDLRGASDTVTLGGPFTQSGSGELVGRLAPAGAQQVVVGGSATLDGRLTLQATAGTYRVGRYRLLTAGALAGRFATLDSNLASLTSLGYGLSYDSSSVYLDLTPSATATLATVAQNANALGRLLALQSSSMAQSLGLDCNRFDARDLCVTVSAGRSRSQGIDSRAGPGTTTAGLAYRVSPQLRYGGFMEWQPEGPVAGQLRQRSLVPALGVFGQWHQEADDMGWTVRASAMVTHHRLEIDRSATDLTEAGQGRTQMASHAVELTASHTARWSDLGRITPYAGLRYGRLQTAGYTETADAATTSPLSFDKLTHRALSAAAGVKVQRPLNERLALGARLGIDHTLARRTDDVSGGSAIAGATRFSMALPLQRRTLANASAGLGYRLDRQRGLGLQVAWIQQATGRSTLMATASYRMGF